MAQRWGDVLDDSDEESDVVQQATTTAGGLVIPPTQKSRIDSKGIQIVTSYRQHPANPKQLMKTITKVRVTTESIREAKAVEERRKWAKFGEALKDESEEGAQRSTIHSKEDIYIEDPNADTDDGNRNQSNCVDKCNVVYHSDQPTATALTNHANTALAAGVQTGGRIRLLFSNSYKF